jgi:hypothetical protein
MLEPLDVDHVVAGQRDETRHALGPQGGGHAGGQAAPVVPGEDRRPEAQGAEQRDQAGTERGLLTAAQRVGGQEAVGP